MGWLIAAIVVVVVVAVAYLVYRAVTSDDSGSGTADPLGGACNEADGGTNDPVGGKKSQPCKGGKPSPCPTTEIEINDTSAVNDDLVLVKCTHPAHRHNVPCRIRIVGSAASSRTIVLTNPDGRLRFPNDADSTKTLTVPADGFWVSFEISGERGSDAIGDAVIEAHCDTATGPLSSKKPATVVWFDQAKIDVTVGGNYAITGGSYTVAGVHTVDYASSARIRPAGVDCSAPQLNNMRIGILQNDVSWVRTSNWDTPAIAWNPGVARGTRVTVPSKIRETETANARMNDSEALVAPLYDQPGFRSTLDANSLKPPIGCASGGTATSHDTPGSPASPLSVPATDTTGAVVGTITYAVSSVLIVESWVTWCTLYNTTTKAVCLLRERTWGLNVDSSAAGDQHATPGASDVAPTMDPITAPPFPNDFSADPANHVTGPAPGSAPITFTK